MITVIARFEMFEEKEIDAVEAIRKMVAAVKEKEPGCLVYTASRGQVNAREVYFFEIFKDEQAYEAHYRTDHMREFQKAMDDYMDNSSFNVETVKQVAGFVREPMEKAG